MYQKNANLVKELIPTMEVTWLAYKWFNLIICLLSPIVDILTLKGIFGQLVIQWTQNQSTYNDLRIIRQLENFDLRAKYYWNGSAKKMKWRRIVGKLHNGVILHHIYIYELHIQKLQGLIMKPHPIFHSIWQSTHQKTFIIQHLKISHPWCACNLVERVKYLYKHIISSVTKPLKTICDEMCITIKVQCGLNNVLL
jgi:hypothetical protein